MLVRHRHDGTWYVIEAPPGSRASRLKLTGMTLLMVPHQGREIPVFDRPSELLVQLAEAGSYGLRLLFVEGRGKADDLPP